MDTKVNAPGIVLSIASGELGGNASKPDIAIGWRHSDSDYGGGAAIYYNDLVALPSTGSDPTGGGVTSMVPTMTINDFNYGVKPAPPAGPYLKDLALGVRSSSSTGALVVLTR
jgi:hypothetical protein